MTLRSIPLLLLVSSAPLAAQAPRVAGPRPSPLFAVAPFRMVPADSVTSEDRLLGAVGGGILGALAGYGAATLFAGDSDGSGDSGRYFVLGFALLGATLGYLREGHASEN